MIRPRHWLIDGFRAQCDVIGALILRELHTRFGRENIGYLWMFAEPMLLAAAVAGLHSHSKLPISGGVRPIPFAIGGYVLFIMFRSVVSRAETVIEANRTLLNHRPVTIPDMLIARSILEATATTAVLFFLLGAAQLAGFADPMPNFVMVLGAIALMSIFSLGLGTIIVCLSFESAMAGRLVHPLLYLSLPLSGAFYSLSWFPAEIRNLLLWVPTVHIFEFLRMGQFAGFESPYVDLRYVLLWSAGLLLIGLIMLRRVRERVNLS